MTTGATVVDNEQRHRFELPGAGFLDYRLAGDRLVLVHTEVAESARGQGVGGRLVQAAVDRAAHEHLTVAPRCPYARQWLEDHPDAAAAVALDAEAG